MRVSFLLFLWAVLIGASPLAMAEGPAAAPAEPAPAAGPASEAEVAPAPVVPANDTSRVGTFKHVEGEVWIIRAAERRRPGPGDGVGETDRLQTGTVAAASILFKDGTALTMGPNTTMDLSRFSFDSTTQRGHFVLDLLQGSVRVITGLLARVNPDLFKVQTPTSVVGVRGTDFIVDAREPL